MRRSFPGALAIVAVVLFATLLPVRDAAAHAELVGSAPADGQVLDALPAEVRAWFTEDISPLDDGLEVWSPSGMRVDDGDVTHGDNARSLRTGLTPSDEQGTYTVLWSVISADGHPIRGSFTFSVGAPSEGGGAHAPGGTPRWATILGDAARGIAYALGLFAIGAVVLAVAPGPGANSRTNSAGLWPMARLAAACLVPAALLVLAAESLAITAGDAGALFDASTREAARDSHHLLAAILAIAGAMVVAVTATVAHGRSRDAASLAGCALVAAGFAWAGHAAAEPDANAWIAVDAVHVIAVGAWAGGLAVLALEGVSMLRRGESPAVLAGRFSRVATLAMPAGVATGIALALTIGPGLGGLLDTDWGKLLATKVALVAVAVAVAVVNRQALLPRLRHAQPGMGRVFLRMTAVESAILSIVVVITGTLVGQSPVPSRTTPTAEAAPPALLDGTIGPYHFVLGVSPAEPGLNAVTIDFHILGDRIGSTPDSVRLSLERRGSTGAPVSAGMRESGAGHFAAEDLDLPRAGTWVATITITIPGQGEESLAIPVEVGQASD